jgi:RimJ/RimL family protein N-acetyltransferase
MAVPKIVTERLTLREIKSKDIFAHTELFSDRETMELFGGAPLTNDLEIKDVIEANRKGFELGHSKFWVVTLTEEREFIGFVRLLSYNSNYFDVSYSSMGDARNTVEFLKYIDKSGWEIDYALLKGYRGNGIMTESLMAILDFCYEANISPLYAKVNSMSNLATVRLLKNSGFVEHVPQLNEKGELGMIYKWEV